MDENYAGRPIDSVFIGGDDWGLEIPAEVLLWDGVKFDAQKGYVTVTFIADRVQITHKQPKCGE